MEVETPGESEKVGGRVKILDHRDGNGREKMIEEIQQGLRKQQKSVPSKYFYDRRGSELFEQICGTPEYYLTRTELAALERSAPDIMDFFSVKGGDLIELGSGSTSKIRKLLEGTDPFEAVPIRYVPVDICKSALLDSAKELARDFRRLEILGIVADFAHLNGLLPRGRKLITFFGSTIGNLTDPDALTLLSSIRSMMNPEDRFLLGMDMLKPTGIIESAYNDSQGITRDFNRNILVRINRELNGDFDPDDFEHLAFFDPPTKRVEMHLRAKSDVQVRIEDLGLMLRLKRGETIHTEICRKFSLDDAIHLFETAGLSVVRFFADSKGWFSLIELRA